MFSFLRISAHTPSFQKSWLCQSLGMSGVFIGHLGLGQAQNGTPIRPQHVSLLYLQALDKLVIPRTLFRGLTRISAALPLSQAAKS
ncbi:hypothetical protein RHMOL_Rhmol08G0186400 [Rhododendron molle]|uniref:Uncharacterized protein n=1 Tax=Rhododendron molle TaxID=49168 RepID=A0ACC0MQW7_RHOML|nr:hypothetical protein RHMOL_Rhmol08G0186400 [Rhododendron molle]